MPPNTGAGGMPRRRDDEERGGGVLAQPSPLGRWPANVIHDGSDEVLAAFPVVSSGARAAGRYAGSTGSNSIGDHVEFVSDAIPASSGSAARFFYCAKASRADRDAGLSGHEADYQHSGPLGHTKNGDGTPRAETAARGNVHPTVKPTDLMRYLVRLVTPPGGTVLDPFAGSGSTGRGAILEGFNFIGCELDHENVRISHARIAAAVIERAEDLELIRMETAQGALF